MKPALLWFGGSSDEKLVSVATAQNLARSYTFAEHWFFHPSGTISRVERSELLAHEKPFEQAFQPKTPPFADSLPTALESAQGHIVFLGFHGQEGEDGEIQRFLEGAEIPFTGSDSASSRLCFEKNLAKREVAAAGLSVAEELQLQGDDPKFAPALEAFFNKHKKIVVKPIANGSSVGLHIIDDESKLKVAIAEVEKSSDAFLAETFIAGRELTVAAVDTESGLKALPASEVLLESGHTFDYQGKYLGRGSREITPAEISAAEMQAAQAAALVAHRALSCFGYSRTDFILTPSGLVFLETNTLPGLTAASFVPQQLQAAGIAIDTFIRQQLHLAEARK